MPICSLLSFSELVWNKLSHLVFFLLFCGRWNSIKAIICIHTMGKLLAAGRLFLGVSGVSRAGAREWARFFLKVSRLPGSVGLFWDLYLYDFHDIGKLAFKLLFFLNLPELPQTFELSTFPQNAEFSLKCRIFLKLSTFPQIVEFSWKVTVATHDRHNRSNWAGID